MAGNFRNYQAKQAETGPMATGYTASSILHHMESGSPALRLRFGRSPLSQVHRTCSSRYAAARLTPSAPAIQLFLWSIATAYGRD